MPAYVVRYGTMRHLGEFTTRADQSYARGDEVIVRSQRGVEWGEILSDATERTREYLGVSKAGDSNSGDSNTGGGRVLRPVSDEDRRSLDELHERERACFAECGDMITERSMQMQLVDIEQVFGGERVVFYYLAEKRVDFRELVKSLAKHFKTRIEMRQIGVRDEARLLADYGDCGKPVCCNTHLSEMPPVSMKMAKIQKATLDPTKISGRCGRLKCCLRYEYDTYVEYRKELPPNGATVITKQGQGRVIGQEILSRKVMISFEDGSRAMTDESDIVTVVKRSGQKSSDDRKTPPNATPPDEKSQPADVN